jgi:outer membrane receptor protein involved in Fe transport
VLSDELLTRPGGPVFDRLHGASAGGQGGRPRHTVEAQGGYTKDGLGIQLNANWRSATFVRGAPGSPVGDLHFGDLARVDVRLFANFGQMRELVRDHPFLRGARMTLSVNNILDEKPTVRDASGATPLSYQPDVLDPVGRTVRISFRKLFF